MSVRAKFKLQAIETSQYGPDPTQKVYKLKLVPVYGGSEENKAFFASTPSGVLELGTVNPQAAAVIVDHRDAHGQFGEFYVDITPVPKPSPAA